MESQTLIEYISNHPDHLGRWAYWLHWVTDYIPGHPDGEHKRHVKSQIFHADPSKNGHDKYTEGTVEDLST